jgi:hypothetical protein
LAETVSLSYPAGDFLTRRFTVTVSLLCNWKVLPLAVTVNAELAGLESVTGCQTDSKGVGVVDRDSMARHVWESLATKTFAPPPPHCAANLCCKLVVVFTEPSLSIFGNMNVDGATVNLVRFCLPLRVRELKVLEL